MLNNNLFFPLICILTISSLYADTIAGRDTIAKDSLQIRHYTLDALRVIGEKPSETIGSVNITNIDYANQPGLQNVKDALTNLPGISMTVGSKDESNLRIRGFRKNEVKILLDGRPLNAGYFGNVNLQNLPVSGISEIQVLKGPVSSMYGSNTLGGVVNLITRDPSTRKWFKLGMSVKRNNTNHFELSTSHRFENWNYWLFASLEHSDGFLLPKDFQATNSENGGVRDNASKTQELVEVKSTCNITDFHMITFTAGVASIPTKYLPSSIYETKYRLYKDYQRLEGTIRSNLQLSPGWKLDSMLYLDGGKDTYQEFNDPNFHHMAMDSDMKNFTIGFTHRANLQMQDGSELSIGYRGERQFSNRKDNGNYPTWTDHSTMLHNLFSQVEWKVSQPLTVTGSAGASYFSKDVEKSNALLFEPSLGVYYEFPNHASLSLAAGRNTAFGTMRQLFSVENGNINLRPQVSMKYEITGKKPFLLNTANGLLSLSLYLNDVKDLIDIHGNTYQNIYKVRSYGGESDLEIAPYSWWNMTYSYCYLDYADLSSYRLTESPRNTVGLNWTFLLPVRTKVTVSSNWEDMRFSEDSNFQYHHLDSYWVHNLALKKEWRDFSITFGLENFTDTNYQEEYGFPAQGINFCFGLEKEF